MMEEAEFWTNPEESTKIVKENKNLKDTVANYKKLETQYEDI
jgi:peptide chain release factor 2